MPSFVSRLALGSSLLWLALTACSSETGLTSLSFHADPDGGRLESDGLVMEIPAGALSEDVTITATPIDLAPSGLVTFSSTWTFEPDGLQFLAPVAVRMAHDDTTSELSVWWTNERGGFAPIATSLEPGWAVASIVHFSRGVVALDEA